MRSAHAVACLAASTTATTTCGEAYVETDATSRCRSGARHARMNAAGGGGGRCPVAAAATRAVALATQRAVRELRLGREC